MSQDHRHDHDERRKRTSAFMESRIAEERSDLNIRDSVIPRRRRGKLTLKAIADRKFGNWL
jgi:hypothetical protein